MLLRTTSTIALIVMVFFAPWWVTFACAIAVAFVVNSYYEILVLGVLIDILYGTSGNIATGYGAIGLIVSSVLLVAIGKIKEELR